MAGRLGDTSERDYARKLRLFSAFAEPELRAAIASLRVASGMRVLDAGCGTGEALGWFAAAVAPGGLAVGIDLSTTHLGAARAALPSSALLLQADLQRIPLGDAIFDIVWSVNTIHHLRDPVAGTLALSELLRPGGRLVLGQSSLLPDMYFAWDAPLDPHARAWLLEAIFRGTWGERLRPYLSPEDHEALTRLCDPHDKQFALHRPDFHFVQTFTLAVGERASTR